MARHYSINAFFRDMPPALLGRYFRRRGLLQDFDFASLNGPAKRDELFEAWLALVEDQRKGIEGDFQEIFSLSRDDAMAPIVSEAAWQTRDNPDAHAAFLEMFSKLPSNYERAMVAFLDYPACWRGANLFYYADTLSRWRKRFGFPHRPAAVDPESIAALAELIREFFHKEGRGKNCEINCLRRDELDYFFCYPQDYSKKESEYINGKFVPRPHTPAFEVLYIYSAEGGWLDLNFRGDDARADKMREIFAKAILKLPNLPPAPKRRRVYELNLFRKPFCPSFASESGIRQVSVKLLRLSSFLVEGDRITVEANPADNPDAVYRLLEQIGRSVDLSFYNVTRAELVSSVVVKAGGEPKAIPISLSYPDSCSLKYDELGLKLRKMLADSGIAQAKPEEPAKNVLAELLSRVSARQGATVYIRAEELSIWSPGVVAVLHSAEILRPVSPAARAVCPGCDRMCFKPVQVRPAENDRPPEMYIDCDEPEAIGRFSVQSGAMARSQTSAEILAHALSRMLDLPSPSRREGGDVRWILGSLTGAHRRASVELVIAGGVALSIGGHEVPVADVVKAARRKLTVDRSALLTLVDRPPCDETPERRRKRLRARIDEVKASGVRAFLRKVAREEGIGISRLKQLVASEDAEAGSSPKDR